MTDRSRRRVLATALFTLPWISACGIARPTARTDAAGPAARTAALAARFALLERDAHARLGVAAFDTGSGGARIAYRADELFPMCSTWKVLAVAALLQRTTQVPTLLQQAVLIRPGDLLEGATVTAPQVGRRMSVEQLCAAAIRYSDNTAGNLLLGVLGGTAEVTAYARTLGDSITRLDRDEPEVNSAFAGDLRDTTTPLAMLGDLQKIVLSGALPAAQAALMRSWLFGSMLGAQRIRAGVPPNWRVADKTAGGVNGVNGDIAVIWPPQRAPLLLAVFVARPDRSNDGLPKVIADATRLVAAAFA
jgi:beta-lactamase class A